MASAVILGTMWEGAERSRVIPQVQNHSGENKCAKWSWGVGAGSQSGFRNDFPHCADKGKQGREWGTQLFRKILNYKDRSDTQGKSGKQIKTGTTGHGTGPCLWLENTVLVTLFRSSHGHPCPGGGKRWTLRSFPTQSILWFSDSIWCRNRSRKGRENNIPREEVSSQGEAKQSQALQFGKEKWLMVDMINVYYK